MLVTPHVLFGAAIGSSFDKVYLVAPLSVASHFVLDSIPHLQGFIEVEELEKKDLLIVFADVLIALILVTLVSFGSPKWELIALGAFCAWVPDIHHIIQVLFGPEKLRRYTKAHKKFHWDKQMKLLPGIATQILVVAVSLFVILKLS